jgi:deazaflavin-dependent oxidoreductase (nitroreductase family)
MPQDWFNPIVKLMLRSPLHGMMSGSTMLITYTGRKTGKKYTLPVGYLRQGDMLTTISSRSRSWWRNLRAEAEVTLLLQGKQVEASAKAVEDPVDVMSGLRSYLAQAPQFANYLDITVDEDGKPVKRDLEREAKQRVLVKLKLASS